jgi:hypothetical protein
VKIGADEPFVNVNINTFLPRSVKKDYLLGFVKVRDNNDITASHNHLPKKKGFKKDIDSGCRDNLAYLAFKVQSDPVLASLDDVEVTENAEQMSTDTQRAGQSNNANSTGNHSSTPATNLITSDFVRRCCIFVGTLNDKGDQFHETINDQVEKLNNDKLATQYLLPRLGSLTNKHGISPSHFTVQWVEQNLQKATAILKLHGLFKHDESLRFVQIGDALLNTCTVLSCEEIVNGNESRVQRIGSYLMTDMQRMIVIRAGSTSSSFLQRQTEHSQCSKLKNASDKDSRLYSSYPNADASAEDKRMAMCPERGEWSHVRSAMAIGWDANKCSEVRGLFEWDEITMACLEQNRSGLTIEKKQDRMLVYLFELILQLSLDGKSNISSNPGFELFNGSFARNRN